MKYALLLSHCQTGKRRNSARPWLAARGPRDDRPRGPGLQPVARPARGPRDDQPRGPRDDQPRGPRDDRPRGPGLQPAARPARGPGFPWLAARGPQDDRPRAPRLAGNSRSKRRYSVGVVLNSTGV